MPSDHKIVGVTKRPRLWTSPQWGDFHAYECDVVEVATGQQTSGVEVSIKTDSPVPQAGDELYGDIDHSGQYGPKFKKASKPGAGGGGASRGRAPARRAGRPDDDPATYAARQAAIARQHSHDVALKFLELRGGIKDGDASDDEILDYVLKLAEKVHEDVSGAARDAFKRVRGAQEERESGDDGAS